MSLAERRRLRLFTLCALYVAQGIPWGFTAITIPAYLAAHGLDRSLVGSALAMTTLPYAFKWVWGPIMDTFTLPRFGRRRPWIVFAQLMMAATIATMIAIPDLTVDLKLLAWMILIHTTFSGLQDVAVDALAVDLLDEDERGRANGLMYASKYGGGVIGGYGLSRVIGAFGLDTALLVQVAILVGIMLVPLLVKERSTLPGPRPAAATVLRSLADVFSLRSVFVMALLVLSINVALGVLNANAFTLFTQHLHWSDQKYTTLTGGFALGAGLGGATLAGLVADKVGHRRLIAIGCFALAAGWVVFAASEARWTNETFVYALAIFETVGQSVVSVGVFALCMDLAWAPVGASQFTTYMSLLNFSTTLGFLLTRELPASFDYRTCYFVAAGFQVGITALLLLIDPAQTRKTLPRPVGVKIPWSGLCAIAVLALLLLASTIYAVKRVVGG